MKEEHYWETKDGKELKISEMETSHIQNAMKMLERKATIGEDIVVSYGYYGDDDYMTGDVEFMQGKEWLAQTDYRFLKRELNKRLKESPHLLKEVE